MNYTKGEWKIVHQDKPQQPFRVYTIIKGLEYDIADVYIAIPNFQNGTEANANLISASPALYEALKKAWALLAIKSHDQRIKVVADECGDALAKAEGK